MKTETSFDFGPAADEDSALCEAIAQARPHLFSPSLVFVSAGQAEEMARVVRAVESVAALPAYREHVLGWAPAIAAHEPGAHGVFFGFDFHLTPEGPRLIEINTNAGGALLCTLQAHARLAGRAGGEAWPAGAVPLAEMEQAFLAMFAEEWREQRGDRPLRTVAIVDDEVTSQYLQPEFVLFQRLFQRHSLEAVIAEAGSLRWQEGALWCDQLRIDLVYNRLTDFSLESPEHAALRAAYLEDEAVVTPHPRAHALYADKRNLAVLGDSKTLLSWGVDEETAALLSAAIPATVAVEAGNAETLWKNRRRLFFKPATGYGSKAAYRGEKLTTRVWAEIVRGQYVAQGYVPPPELPVEMGGEVVSLKYDVRCYAYRGRVQLMAARLYQGQTTNFRTPGGGFAPVCIGPG